MFTRSLLPRAADQPCFALLLLCLFVRLFACLFFCLCYLSFKMKLYRVNEQCRYYGEGSYYYTSVVEEPGLHK